MPSSRLLRLYGSLALLTFSTSLLYYYYTFHFSKRPRRLEFSSELVSNHDQFDNLLVVTRVHMKAASKMPDAKKLVEFVKHSKQYTNKILVCVGADEYIMIMSYIDHAKQLLNKESLLSIVQFMPVRPWGYFIFPLNVALQYAQDIKSKYIAFQV